MKDPGLQIGDWIQSENGTLKIVRIEEGVYLGEFIDGPNDGHYGNCLWKELEPDE
jgi:hypothetical protein